MKRIIIIILAIIATVLLLMSCDKQIAVREAETNEVFDIASTFYYRGHQFIKFERGNQCGVTHDPECPCFEY